MRKPKSFQGAMRNGFVVRCRTVPLHGKNVATDFISAARYEGLRISTFVLVSFVRFRSQTNERTKVSLSYANVILENATLVALGQFVKFHDYLHVRISP